MACLHDCVAGFAAGSGFAEGPQAVGSGQVGCHGHVAVRITVFAGGRAGGAQEARKLLELTQVPLLLCRHDATTVPGVLPRRLRAAR